MLNNFHKKEAPLQGFAGFGGGITRIGLSAGATTYWNRTWKNSSYTLDQFSIATSSDGKYAAFCGTYNFATYIGAVDADGNNVGNRNLGYISNFRASNYQQAIHFDEVLNDRLFFSANRNNSMSIGGANGFGVSSWQMGQSYSTPDWSGGWVRTGGASTVLPRCAAVGNGYLWTLDVYNNQVYLMGTNLRHNGTSFPTTNIVKRIDSSVPSITSVGNAKMFSAINKSANRMAFCHRAQISSVSSTDWGVMTHVFDLSGNHIRTHFMHRGKQDSNAVSPLAVAIDSQGDVYQGYYDHSSGYGQQRYLKYSGSGGRLWEYEVTSTSSNKFSTANGVAVDKDDNVYFHACDYAGDRSTIYKVSSSGTDLQKIAVGSQAGRELNNAYGAFTCDGESLYFAGYFGDHSNYFSVFKIPCDFDLIPRQTFLYPSDTNGFSFANFSHSGYGTGSSNYFNWGAGSQSTQTTQFEWLQDFNNIASNPGAAWGTKLETEIAV